LWTSDIQSWRDHESSCQVLVNPSGSEFTVQVGFGQPGQVFCPGSPYADGWSANIRDDFPGGNSGAEHLTYDRLISFGSNSADATHNDRPNIHVHEAVVPAAPSRP
jgi:hypothetical protein